MYIRCKGEIFSVSMRHVDSGHPGEACVSSLSLCACALKSSYLSVDRKLIVYNSNKFLPSHRAYFSLRFVKVKSCFHLGSQQGGPLLVAGNLGICDR